MRMAYPVFGSATAPAAGSTQYHTVDAGKDSTWVASASFALREHTVNTPFEVKDLYVQVDTAPGVGNSRTFALAKATSATAVAATAVTVTISDNNTSASVTLPQGVSWGIGDTIVMQSSVSGTPAAAGGADWYFTVYGRDQQCFSLNATAASNSVDSFQVINGSYSATAEPTESDAQAPMPMAGTISMADFRAAAGAPGGATSYVVTLRVNGADTAVTGTISASSSTAQDYSNSVTVAKGDLVCWRITPSGTPTARAITISYRFTPSTFGQSFSCFSLQGSSSTSAVRYIAPSGRGQGTFNATETATDVLVPGAVTVIDIEARVGTAPNNGAGTQQYVFQTRLSAANNGPSATISETSTTANGSTDSSSTTAGQPLSVSITPSGTPLGTNGVGIGLAFSMSTVADGIVEMCSAELGTASSPYYGGALNASGSFSIDGTTKRTGSYSYRINPTTTAVGYFDCSGTDPDNKARTRGHYLQDAWYGFYLNIATLPASNSEEILTILDSSGGTKCTLRINSAGKVDFYNSATTLIGTGTTVLSTGVWNRIELKVGTGASGAYDLRIAGVSEYSGTTNVGTVFNGIARFGKNVNRNSQTIDINIDDIRISDTGFASKDWRVALSRVNAAGAVNTWTDGAGSDTYTDVDEIPPSASDYLLRKAAGGDFSLKMQTTPGDVLAVKQFGYFADGAAAQVSCVSLRLRTGSTNYDYGAYDFDSTEQQLARVWNTDATGSAWSNNTFNTAEIGAYTQRTTSTGVSCTWIGALVMYTEGSGSILLLGVG